MLSVLDDTAVSCVSKNFYLLRLQFLTILPSTYHTSLVSNHCMKQQRLQFWVQNFSFWVKGGVAKAGRNTFEKPLVDSNTVCNGM